jgi:hypothetical protein
MTKNNDNNNNIGNDPKRTNSLINTLTKKVCTKNNLPFSINRSFCHSCYFLYAHNDNILCFDFKKKLIIIFF